MKNMVRQGDVLLVATDRNDTGTQEPPAADGSIVLALGEATGHRHRFADSSAVVADAPRVRQLRVVGGTSALLHEEHSPIEVPAGRYDLPRQVEWTDDLEPIAVKD